MVINHEWLICQRQNQYNPYSLRNMTPWHYNKLLEQVIEKSLIIILPQLFFVLKMSSAFTSVPYIQVHFRQTRIYM